VLCTVGEKSTAIWSRRRLRDHLNHYRRRLAAFSRKAHRAMGCVLGALDTKLPYHCHCANEIVSVSFSLISSRSSKVAFAITMNPLANMQMAIVDENKVTLYLLSDAHPTGRAKSAFFQRFGFSPSSWLLLKNALLDHAQFGVISSEHETAFGRNILIEGPIRSPDGRNPLLRTIWFVAAGEEVPRLVTAVPIAGGRE